ncbi:MAG TPA: hypothetical protein VKV04_25310 [Verrucomicrobiae bacterium]|nr:hypothetical protein [Verrucomicrobiae bacterium]
METPKPKRDFFEKPSIGSVIIIIVGLALTAAFGLYREHRISVKMDAVEHAQAQEGKQAYLDGVELAARDAIRQGAPESAMIDETVILFRQKGATDSEIDALKQRLSTSASDKK